MNAWTAGSRRLWQVYFAVCFTAVCALTFVTGHAEPVGERIAVAVLLAAMAGWYLWGGGARFLFQPVLFVMFTTATLLIGPVGLLLFAIAPLIYMTLPIRVAHAAIVAYALVSPVAFLARTGDLQMMLTMYVPLAIGTVVVSVVSAVSLIRAHLLSVELQESRAEVARLSHQAGIIQERQRLAGDIHDTVAQGLSSVVMLLQAADRVLDSDPGAARGHIELATATARDNVAEARALVAALTPAPLAEASLVDALRRLVEKFEAETGTPGWFELHGNARSLGTGIEVVVLRVAQEALANVRKHARAGRVTVKLAFSDATATLTVGDNGVGFRTAAGRTGYGLDGMRSRVAQVGGLLSVDSVPEIGTTVRMEVGSVTA